MATQSKLLPANSDYLIVDVFDMFIENTEGDVMVMDRLTSASVESSLDSTEIRGGKGNGLIATLAGNRTVNVTSETPVFSLDALAVQLNADIVTGAGVACKSNIYEVKGGKVTLEETPISGSIRVYSSTGISKPTATNKEITITGTDEKVKVFYKYATAATSESMTISAKKFPTAKRMYLQTLVIDSAENAKAILEIDFPNAKPDGAFNLNTSSTREAGSNSITWSILADAAGSLGTIKLIPIE